MALILVVGAGVAMGCEAAGNALLPAGRRPGARQHGGQGGPLRRGGGRRCAPRSRPARAPAPSTPLHDSLTPIGGLVPLFNMLLGEITPGGVGAGLYGMLVFAILAVFIAGLMVGRTPEYLGKKIEAFEMKMAMLVVLVAGGERARLHGARHRRRAGRARRARQRRPARLQRDPLRVRQPDRQQRLGLRRPDRQHALLQHHRRPGDARSAGSR